MTPDRTTAEYAAALARLSKALEVQVAAHEDIKDALAQQQARAETMADRLQEAEHAKFAHALIPSQRAIKEVQDFRDSFAIEVRAALAVAANVGQELDVDGAFTMLSNLLTPPIFRVLSALREIEMACGAAGYCAHMRKPVPAVVEPRVGWTATREGAVAKVPALSIVRGSDGR